MITSLSFANPRPAKPVRPFGFTVRNADNDNQQWEAPTVSKIEVQAVTRMRCVLCTRTHCSCSGEGPLGAR